MQVFKNLTFFIHPVGPRYVLMNQHMLLHLKKSVIHHGPPGVVHFLYLKTGMVTDCQLFPWNPECCTPSKFQA